MRHLARSGDGGPVGGVSQRFGADADQSIPVREQVTCGLVRTIVFLTCLVSVPAIQAADAVHEYVFLVDTSASMRKNRLVGPLRVALDDFADTIPKDGTSRVWIFTFDSGLNRSSLARQLNRTEDLQEAKIFLNEIEYQGRATYIYQSFDGVLAAIERTMRDGKSHDFTIHLFTDGVDNGPTAYSFEKNAERFVRLRQVAGNAVELYYHALKTKIPANLARVIQGTEGMYSIAGVGMPPKARFSLPKVDVTDNAPLTFVNETIGQVDSHAWTFGDGAVSKEENPTHAFKTPGKYTVTLTASNPAGKSTASKEVEVRGGPPRAKFAIHAPDKPKYAGEPVRFIDQSTGQITLRAWQFGDVRRQSTIAETEFVFQDVGRVKVTLGVIGPFGKDTHSIFLTIEQRPSVAFSFFPKEPVQKNEILFVNQSKGDFRSWRWQFGDGETSEEMSPRHVFDAPGTYKVQLDGQDSTGASKSATKEFVVRTGYIRPVAKFALPVQTIGVGMELTLTDQSTGTIESRVWDMGDGTVIENPAAKHAYGKAGTFTVSLTVSGPAGSSTAKEDLVVKPAMLSFSVRPTHPLDGNPVTFVNESLGDYRDWKWDFGDGKTSNEKNPQHTYTEPREYVVKLTAIGPCGDPEETSKTLTVVSSAVAPEAKFLLQIATIEIGESISLSHESTGTITKVEWDMGDGTILSGDKVEHRYAKPGEYTITLTVSNEADSDSTSHTLTVRDMYREPTIAFGVRGEVRGTAPFEITIDNRCGGSIRTFRWDFGDGSTSDDREPRAHAYTKPGKYTISLTVVDQKDQTLSSTSSQNVIVEVLPPPPPPRYPKWVPWVVAVGWYAIAWLCVWRQWWPWSRRSILYQQDGIPRRYVSWSRNWTHESDRFAVVMRRTVGLCKRYHLKACGRGVSARDMLTGDRLSNEDHIRRSCELQINEGEHVAIQKLNNSTWSCVLPHALALAISVLVLTLLLSLR